MCGIVAFVGESPCVPTLIQGLKRLEYRGYDSAGLAYFQSGKIEVHRAVGRVQELEKSLDADKIKSTIGIAHTRWATHGRPTKINAHPHRDISQKLALVHNGVIENHLAIREFLITQGVICQSETDTECLVQLIGFFYRETGDLLESVRIAMGQIQGSLGISLLCSDLPKTIIAARRGSPLLIGKGEHNYIIASDASPFVDSTKLVTYLDDDEIVCVRPDGLDTTTADARVVEKTFSEIHISLEDVELSDFKHHMHKEIHEQPTAIQNTLRGRLDADKGKIKLGGLEGFERQLALAKRVVLFGCGTAWHAGLVGEFLFESIAGIPAEVEYASELRYRNPIIEPDTIAIGISQSGETADTLAAIEEVEAKGALTFGVVNTVGSSIARSTNAGVFLHVGPEIGVASTKAFTAQVSVLAMMAISLGRRKRLSEGDASQLIEHLSVLPSKIETVLRTESHCEKIAQTYASWDHWLYLGRGINYPVALEGALKLKEVSYIHAEGLPAAEMKHGPIALIEEGTPVVVLATHDHTYEKVLANIEEVRSRGGKIIAIADDNDENISRLADHVIFVPPTLSVLSPILTTIPLQLIAYHAALAKGRDVDRPRNLAKSVTVE